MYNIFRGEVRVNFSSMLELVLAGLLPISSLPIPWRQLIQNVQNVSKNLTEVPLLPAYVKLSTFCNTISKKITWGVMARTSTYEF